MTAGSKSLVINNLERALSTDINRLQTFKDAGLSQLANWLFGVQQANTELFPGYITEFLPGALDPYQNSVIVNGLMPYPLNGTVNLLVTPGLAFMEDASYTADQSPYRYVDDPGVTGVGTLTLTPAPGATRIDIIECSLVETVLEQSNRDIYNPTTGLFTPTLIDKVKAGRLQYRIREGVAGGGFPSVVTGWLPLAVVSVPAGAATWDDCTLWDVRPLLSASQNAPFVEWIQDTDSKVFWSSAAWDAGLTKLLATGKVTCGLGPYNQSGILGNHPTDDIWIDLADLNNWGAGAAPVADRPYYLWALTPFSLPGWRKYSGASLSPRRPSGMAGIMTVSSVGPTSRGFPSMAIALPTATGLNTTTSFGVLAACGMVSPLGIGQPFVADGDWVHLYSPPAFAATSTGGASGATTSTYTLTDNVYYPANARALKMTVARGYTAGPTPTQGIIHYTVRVVDTVTGNEIALVKTGSQAIYLPTGSGNIEIDFDLPLYFNYALTGTRGISIDWVTTWGTAAPGVLELAQIIAWKMTP